MDRRDVGLSEALRAHEDWELDAVLDAIVNANANREHGTRLGQLASYVSDWPGRLVDVELAVWRELAERRQAQLEVVRAELGDARRELDTLRADQANRY